MFQQLQASIIVGLIIILLVVGGIFWLDHSSNAATIATLNANVAKYEVAIETQDKTINQMKVDAKTLADSTKVYTDSVQKTETNFVVDWQVIDSLDLNTKTNTADELERKINDEFQKSIDGLKTTTGGKSDGVSSGVRNN